MNIEMARADIIAKELAYKEAHKIDTPAGNDTAYVMACELFNLAFELAIVEYASIAPELIRAAVADDLSKINRYGRYASGFEHRVPALNGRYHGLMSLVAPHSSRV